MSTSDAPAGEALLDRAWKLNPSVSVRPEPFGALLYHFGSRRLSFLKDRRLLAVLEELPGASCARQALTRAGLAEEAEVARYAAALTVLAQTDMILERV